MLSSSLLSSTQSWRGAERFSVALAPFRSDNRAVTWVVHWNAARRGLVDCRILTRRQAG